MLSSESFVNEIVEEVIKNQASTWNELKEEIATQVVNDQDVLYALQSVGVDTYPLKEAVSDVWHSRFRKVTERYAKDKIAEQVVCGFSQVEDDVAGIAGLTAFVNNALKAMANLPEQVAAASTSDIENMAGVIRALRESFENPGDNKYTLSKTFLHSLEEKFNLLIKKGNARRFLGGAPAIIADVLSSLGIHVNLATMYFPDPMRELYRKAPKLQPPTSPSGYEHPIRRSFIFAFGKGDSFQLGNDRVLASRDDRCIFRVRAYLRNHRGVWEDYTVSCLDGQRKVKVRGPKCESDEWPFVPGFVRLAIKDQEFEISFLNGKELEQLPKWDYAILNAPSLRTFPIKGQLVNAAHYLQAKSLLEQLRTLAARGTKIHIEFSGKPQRGRDHFQPFRERMEGRLHSFGINHSELKLLTELDDFDSAFTLAGTGGEVFHRYQRALAVAVALGLERIYVHGNDVDIILRKGAAAGTMRQEVQADLFAKGFVVFSLLRRTLGERWRDFLEADYELALANKCLEIATREAPRAKATLRNVRDLINESQNYLNANDFGIAKKKAGDAVEKLKRLKKFPTIYQTAQEEVRPSLSLTLLPNSFKALVQFASDFVRHKLQLHGEQAREAFEKLINSGYYVERGPEGYSVAVIPIMWPQLPIWINPTGAGDITSGVAAVYAGF